MTSQARASADALPTIAVLVQRGRDAARAVAARCQSDVDLAVRATAWAIYKPANARLLAEMAVEETGLGNVESKIIKNTRKTFGTLRDLMRASTVGEIGRDRGIVKFAKPVGLVAAVCPATNPSATPANKAMMALKGGNAVIIAPSPGAYRTSARTVELIRDALERIGQPPDLVQVLPQPVSKDATAQLVEMSDLAVVTGSQNNVRRAMQSGSVAIGVGAGNVPVIVDSTADLEAATRKIAASKCFDNATSCSSENAVIILDDVYHATLDALRGVGAFICTPDEKQRIADRLWKNGVLDRTLIARDAPVLAAAFALPPEASSRRFFVVEEDEVGGAGSFADEKLSLVLTAYRAADFAHALRITRALLEVRGKGHSVGIHTRDDAHARTLAETVDVVRVLVNQAHTFGNGGGFDNALPFTLSMGGGTWAGNIIGENLNYRHFINVTHLVSTIAEDKPSEAELFAPLSDACGGRDG